MKNKEFIKNKEYYVTNIKNIIKVINNCDDIIKTICCGKNQKYIFNFQLNNLLKTNYFGFCLKCKKINDIINHRCKYMVK